MTLESRKGRASQRRGHAPRHPCPRLRLGNSPHVPLRPAPQNQGENAPGLMAELEGAPGFADCEPQVQAIGRGLGISNIYPKVKQVAQVGPGGHYKQQPLALYKLWDTSHHRRQFGEPKGGRASPRTAASARGPPGLCHTDRIPGWATDRPRLPQGLVGSEPQPLVCRTHGLAGFLRSGVHSRPVGCAQGRERGWAAPSGTPKVKTGSSQDILAQDGLGTPL